MWGVDELGPSRTFVGLLNLQNEALAFQTDGAAQSVVGKARNRKSLKRAGISLIVSTAFLRSFVL
jgi:hypothetical protein